MTHKEYLNIREYKLKNINFYYEKIITKIKKITPIDFINNYLNQNLLNKQNLISTNFSKEIPINESILKKLIIGEKNSNFKTVDEEINYIITSKSENFKINEIKKYLPFDMGIEYFPSQKDIQDKSLNKADFQKENLNKEEDDDNSSKETKYTIEDSCKLIEELNEKIKAFRKENQQTKEKEKMLN